MKQITYTKENAVEMAKTIDAAVLNEIEFMLGDSVACEEILNDVLDRNGYIGDGFVMMDVENDAELILDIYNEFFATGILTPFVPERWEGNTRLELDEMPYDKTFDVDGNRETCHATGYEVFIDGGWWDEYIDSNGDLHYGR